MRFWAAIIGVILSAGTALAVPPDGVCSSGRYGPVQCINPQNFVFDTCRALDNFARTQGLDPGFFARLIWQESRFDPFALSPAGAQGIAQFMPQTAKLRGLSDPYNPALALEHSAAYLAEMKQTFGNPGLAAIGYNGGEARADGIIAGTGGLAQETIDYVAIITGLSWQDWLQDDIKPPDLRLSKTEPFLQACSELARKRRLSPPPRAKQRFKPWGVQLAFATTKKGARADFTRKTRSCASKVKGKRPIWSGKKAGPARRAGTSWRASGATAALPPGHSAAR
ncbi:lytic transglycosylase domain-containing protein [Aquicoccus sp. G2-2]|uniref:lytic transglycosylase domain-containing protein n=1 Tax=Aquicoccus sp. G2-2 TaxID=3092120 RepID=UPI002AE023AC|nr:lytic transglycosylase domain-containing protein [Aquicoccus sp. G2-2]MEA1114142.1 lytic transglycosylase domain-containing protein [Aquicoccus sp. G2-2]